MWQKGLSDGKDKRMTKVTKYSKKSEWNGCCVNTRNFFEEEILNLSSSVAQIWKKDDYIGMSEYKREWLYLLVTKSKYVPIGETEMSMAA